MIFSIDSVLDMPLIFRFVGFRTFSASSSLLRTLTERNVRDPRTSLFKAIVGRNQQATPETRSAIREKASNHGFQAIIRIGSYANASAANGHIFAIFSALKALTSPGVRISLENESPDNLNNVYVPPPRKFPLKLTVKELSTLFLLPVGDGEFPGMPGVHPRILLPPNRYYNPPSKDERTFAIAPDGKRLSVSTKDSLFHEVLVGSTGVGKSTVMLNKVMSDINSGKSLLLIDPKQDLVTDILSRIPEHRDSDVVIIDPSSERPVGINVLANRNNPGLIADCILAVLSQVFSENWGIRSMDVLSASLLTLAQCEGANLLHLPLLLTNENFRHGITSKITDRIGLQPFWNGFEAMKDSERRQEVAPSLNKLRQYILRPGLRGILGQSNPKFSLSELFTKPRIILVPLNSGLIGAESAKLLGSLIVSQVWGRTLARANIPAERRYPISIYIDELQDYLALPGDLSSALAQARGLGVSFCMAHQFRTQLPVDIKAAIDANARSKIAFNMSAADAKEMAAMAPELEAEDFMLLKPYHIYTSFMANGESTCWISGKTLPPPPAFRDPNELKTKSMMTYGRPIQEIENEYLSLLERVEAEPELPDFEPDTPIGRRRI
ncbi:MAG: type IV secretion system DNA-binding domain-containing protein [Oscillospiraceae bacterium]|nr:type IV secretion system DNA-binding domain-containing protein [Oscillospiraceae bacterium]